MCQHNHQHTWNTKEACYQCLEKGNLYPQAKKIHNPQHQCTHDAIGNQLPYYSKWQGQYPQQDKQHDYPYNKRSNYFHNKPP